MPPMPLHGRTASPGAMVRRPDMFVPFLFELRDPKLRKDLSPEELAMLEHLSPEELRRLFEERLREQKERHDGGNRWIGTGGTSPFGAHGAHPTGMRVGPKGGGRSAMAIADARAYRPYRSDL